MKGRKHRSCVLLEPSRDSRSKVQKNFNSSLFHLALFRVKIFNCSCTVSNIKSIQQFSRSVPICCIPKRIFCLSFQAGFSHFIALHSLLLPLSFIFVGQCESTLNCFSKAHYLKDSSLPSDKLKNFRIPHSGGIIMRQVARHSYREEYKYTQSIWWLQSSGWFRGKAKCYGD